MKTLYVDIMVDGRFIHTLQYRIVPPPLAIIDLGDLYRRIIQKLPSLKCKCFEACIENQTVHYEPATSFED